jgi:ligand-binding sensor domain-containing protein
MTTKRWLTILLLSLTLTCWITTTVQVSAQSDELWQTYTNSNCVRDLAIEGDYVWAATCGGVVRWDRRDGSYVKYITADGLVDNDVHAVTIDPAGRKWFGTSRGVSKFDGRNWITYTAKNGLGSDKIYAIAFDHNGHIWMTAHYSHSQFGKFDGQTWTDYTNQTSSWIKEFFDVTSDTTGNIWAATDRIGVICFDGQTWTTYTQEDGLLRDGADTIAVDEAGNIWASNLTGLSKFDGQTWTMYRVPWFKAGNGPSTVAVDQTGQVWFANRDGVRTFDGQAWQDFFDDEDLGLNLVKAIAVDGDNHKWFATDRGLVRFDGQRWTSYRTNDGPVSNDVRELIINETDGSLWAATGQGLSQFDGQHWTTYTAEDGLAYDDVSSLAIDQGGNIWIGNNRYTEGAVSRFDGHNWTTYTTADGLLRGEVTDIAVDFNGHIWVGTDYYGQGGLNVYDGQRWTTYSADNGLAGNGVSKIVVDLQGRIWVSNINWGGYVLRRSVSVFDGHSWTHYGTDGGLVRGTIRELAVDYHAGDILIGTTTSGVLRFDGETWSDYIIPDRLGREEAFTIATDQSGNIWVNNRKFDDCTSTIYTNRGNLTSYNVRDIVFDKAGGVWFATSNGISHFDNVSIINTEIDPTDNVAVQTLLVGPGQPGRLYALTDEDMARTLLVSDDFGDHWTLFAGGLPVEPTCLHNLDMDYATPDALYASTCQGLYRWSDGEWRLISPKEIGMVSVPYGHPDTLWATIPAGLVEVPVWRSHDGGSTWHMASRYLDHSIGVAKVIPDPLNADIIYATVLPTSADGNLRRGTSNGQWATMPTPLNNRPVETNFALDGATGTMYVATNYGNGQLWRTCQPRVQDVNAVEWESLHEFGETLQVEILASGWSPNGQALYINLKDVTDTSEQILHRSLDGGHTWSPLPIEF